ncbi:MAG: DEAD/DEAH box helicase [Candidatus Bathyarchaeia archaeon]
MDQVFTLLQRPLLNHLARSGIERASVIQRLAIPRILEGRNVLLIAPTGTGKTLAAVLPVFDMFLSRRQGGEFRERGVKILYVTPLRALNRDIYRRVMALGSELGIDVQVRHGDTSIKVRETQAKHPPDMLITTPETLQAILPGKRLRKHLKAVRWVVVDEIHELAMDKRGVQLSLALERLRDLTGEEYQRIGLSATVGEPETVASFLAGANRAVEVVKSPEVKMRDVSVEFNYPDRSDVEEGERIGVPASYVSKVKRILELTSKSQSTLIFSNTREHAEAIGSMMKALNPEVPIKVHHGSLSRELREEAERGFLEGEVKGIVCTSSLELGIDVGTVDLVVHYLSPRQAVRLVQRVGRSGHSVEAVPRGRIIASWADDILEAAVIVQRAGEEDLEPPEIPESPYDVLAHQIVGLTLDKGRLTMDEIYRVVKRAYPYRSLTVEELQGVLSQMEKLGLVRVRGESVYPKPPRAHRYYYENLSVIPDVKRYDVYDFIGKRRIGTLDQEFAVKRCHPNVKIIMHGHTWTVINRDDENLKVEVEPSPPTLEAIPSWEGEIIPVDFKTALRVGQLRERVADRIEAELDASVIVEELKAELNLNEGAARKVVEALRDQAKRHGLPTHNRILVERYENILVVHACYGNRVNETLALMLTSLLKSRYGVNFTYQVDPYRIGITCPHPVNPVVVKEMLTSIRVEDVKPILDSAIEDSEMLTWRHWHVARRFGVVEKKADYKPMKARMLVDVFRGSVILQEAVKEVYGEKLDLPGTETVIGLINEGRIRVDLEYAKEPSPLAAPMLDKLVPHGLLRPLVSEKPVPSIVEERLTSATVKLVCMHKGDWEGVRVVGNLPTVIRCPKCRSTLIAAVHPNDVDLMKAVKKKLRGGKLSVEEQATWMRGWRSASLIQIYGKRAAVALAGHGVGPTMAARILKSPVKSEEEFYMNILRAERLYARTRSFWD